MNKKKKILDAALYLFANHGVPATTTRAIAQEAEVSEGLIFRHFNNKEVLLQSVLDNGIEQINKSFETILKIEHPRVLLKQFMSIAFQFKKHDELFWRFFLSHQWRNSDSYQNLMNPIEDRITQAFKILDREDPKTDAQCYLAFFNAIIVVVLMQQTSNAFGMVNNILEKFDLT